jgi:hypothetical protein
VKAVLSVLSALALFIVIWAAMAGMLYVMGLVAFRSGYGGGLMMYLHVFFMWVLSPGVGALCAVIGAASLFKNVSVQTVYVGFVSVLGTLFGLMFLFDLLRGGSGFQTLLFGLQIGAIFFGAWIGGKWTRVSAQA